MSGSDTTGGTPREATETDRSRSEQELWAADAELAAMLERCAEHRGNSEEWQEAERHELNVARKEALRQWQVPKRLMLALHHLKRTPAVQAVEEWQETPPTVWCLVLSATQGAGKSCAAAWWLWVQSRKLGTGRKHRAWWPAVELAALDSYGDEIEQVCRLPVLVLDDLGVEYSDASGACQAKLDRLIDHRYRECKPTVITTNLAVASFSSRYGPRVARRVREGRFIGLGAT